MNDRYVIRESRDSIGRKQWELIDTTTGERARQNPCWILKKSIAESEAAFYNNVERNRRNRGEQAASE